MSEAFEPRQVRLVRQALAHSAYQSERLRIAHPSLDGHRWLVTTPRGLFAASERGVRLIAHGWFFGVCRDQDNIFLFENCALRDRTRPLGRLLRIALHDGQLGEATVLAKGLDANCHQLRIVGECLCLVDTAGQAVLRFTRSGELVDRKRPFPAASPDDRSGGYLHLNAIAKIGDEIALMLHNGKAEPARPSEIAWLGPDWSVRRRQVLADHGCHDIVQDHDGTLWHCASEQGAIVAGDGRRAKISSSLMTRGLALESDCIVVGLSSFGPRQNRDGLGGAIAVLNRDLSVRQQIDIPAPPADIVSL